MISPSDPEPANEEPANEEPAAMEQFDEIEEPNLDEITMENNQEEAPIMTQEEPELAAPQTDPSESIVDAPNLSTMMMMMIFHGMI